MESASLQASAFSAQPLNIIAEVFGSTTEADFFAKRKEVIDKDSIRHGHLDGILSPIRKRLHLPKFIAIAGSSSAPSLAFRDNTGSWSFTVEKLFGALFGPRLPPAQSESGWLRNQHTPGFIEVHWICPRLCRFGTYRCPGTGDKLSRFPRCPRPAPK